MPRIFAVRHGQASFMAADYDQLSELGADQMRILGAWWSQRKLPVTRLFVGPLKRHRQSLAAFTEGLGTNSVAVSELPSLDEYPALELLTRAVPLYASRDETLAGYIAQLSGPPDEAAKVRENIFRYVSMAWVRGEIAVEGIPPFSAFRRTVEQGTAEIMASTAAGETALVMTSGGVVAAMAGHAQALDDSNTLEISWVIRNASVSEFRFSGDRFSLMTLNETPHLDDDTLVTYR